MFDGQRTGSVRKFPFGFFPVGLKIRLVHSFYVNRQVFKFFCTLNTVHPEESSRFTPSGVVRDISIYNEEFDPGSG